MTPVVAPLAPSECLALAGEDAALLDLREPAAFAQGHPAGAINVRHDDRHLAERVTLIIGAVPRLVLLASVAEQIDSATSQLTEAGFEVLGVASSAPAEWARAGAPWITLNSIESGDLGGDPSQRQFHVLDVREPMEWAVGHVPGAQLIALGEVRERLAELPAGRDLAIICEAGVRSSSAASVLQAAGFTRLFNVTDGTAGWRAAGRPMEVTEEDGPDSMAELKGEQQ